MPITTIQDVLDELGSIILETEKDGSRAGYFAVLYHRMTLAVQQHIINGSFADPARMEQLDVTFAKRYIDAYHAYKSGAALSSGWKYAFDMAKTSPLTVIQHLMLGVNTHINLDLGIAAAAISTAETINDMQADFERINDIIASLTDEVQTKLTKVFWPMRLLRSIVNDRQTAVINFSIVAARKAAWANALLLANADEQGAAAHVRSMDETVTRIATGVAHPGFPVSWLLQVIRWFENKDVATNIQLIK